MRSYMEYLDKVKELIDRIEVTDIFHITKSYEAGVREIVELLKKCKKQRNGLFFCGNGGSAGIAQHMTADFLKNGGIQTHSLYEQTTLTCISNDLTYDFVFCRQLELMAGSEDILIAISSSGESENIVKAINTMHQIKGNVITFTGFRKDNRIRKLGDVNIYVPTEHYGMVESIHNIVLQHIVDMIVEEDGIAMKL